MHLDQTLSQGAVILVAGDRRRERVAGAGPSGRHLFGTGKLVYFAHLRHPDDVLGGTARNSGPEPTFGLLAGLYGGREIERYRIRMRCSPQPGMRAVAAAHGGYACWSYEDYAWTVKLALTDRNDALSWWLADPWLPNQQFEYGILADGARRPGETEAPQPHVTQWAEITTALALHVVSQTGVRPDEVGPESTETAALVYQRMRERRAAAQVYWHEGRNRLDDLRGCCPVRIDIAPMLLCVVLAEAAALLSRRPHVESYIGIDEAPPGVAADAAAVLRQFDVPRQAYHLLVR